VKQVTAVAFSDGADKIFSGGIDNEIKVWDLRKNEVSMKLQGHTETITSMQLSPDGSYLLTNSMDCTLRVWDMRPYAPQVHYPFHAQIIAHHGLEHFINRFQFLAVS
jgi:Prp8 binding protein